KLVMIGDSFLTGAAENVKSYLSDKYEVLSIVKPGAGLSVLTQSITEEVSALTSMEVLVLGGGSIDLDQCKVKTAYKLITDFAILNNHINIILLNVPKRYDLQNYSHMNDEIRKYNSKLSKIAKAFTHIKFIEVDTKRNNFRKHGLHFNKFCKAHLAKQIASTVQLLLGKKSSSPLVLDWLSDITVYNDKVAADISFETDAIQNKNTNTLVACNNNRSNRTSKRVKKIPRTRTNDFLWQI
ncbi:hypothetical protein B7P43_G12110, partial [Cryptotermes secundus]